MAGGPPSALSLQETQAHLLIRNQDNAGHTLHLPCLRRQDHLVLLDQLGGKMHTGQLTSVVCIHCPPLHDPHPASLPLLPEASFTPPWPTHLPPLPTHPCQQQLHLQLRDPAAQASPDPIAKGHRAEWVLDPEGIIRLTLLQPAMGMEALRLREDARVPGHHIVAEHELGLQRKNGQHISLGPWGTPRNPSHPAPLTFLGKRKPPTSISFSVITREFMGTTG